MQVNSYVFQSPYCSPVQVGRVDNSNHTNDKSEKTQDDKNNKAKDNTQASKNAETFENTRAKEARSEMAPKHILNTYA